MHPRCRSTISAVIEGGTRTAKAGKNVRIPADWNYEKWRGSLEVKPERTKITPHLRFDVQRFSDYERQVASHGGSGNITPDSVHSSHSGNPRQAQPLQIIDHKNRDGKIDKRAFYDAAGLIYLEIHTTNHGFPKTHPFGKSGSHAHDMNWINEKTAIPQKGRELTAQESEDNKDIL